MTGQAVLNNILSMTDHKSTDSAYRALALIWLDLVLKDIQNRQENYHWRFLEVKGDTFLLVADDFDYVLTGASKVISNTLDSTKIVHVYDKIDNITYRFVPYELLRKLVADETEHTGDTFLFSLFGNELLLYPVPDFDAVTGTATSTSSGELVDSSATFITDGVKAGMRATDTGSSQTALITSVDSETELTLDTDIFVATEAYSISKIAYIDYVKMMSDAADSSATMDIPDKWKKVVYDGVLSFAYEFDPELGDAVKKKLDYENGVQKMINENAQVIAESKKPMDHRTRRYTRSIVDGKSSLYLPLDSESI